MVCDGNKPRAGAMDPVPDETVSKGRVTRVASSSMLMALRKLDTSVWNWEREAILTGQGVLINWAIAVDTPIMVTTHLSDASISKERQEKKNRKIRDGDCEGRYQRFGSN